MTDEKPSRAKEIADRLRKKIKEDPSTVQRLVKFIDNICPDCGGELDDGQHGDGCPREQRGSG